LLVKKLCFSYEPRQKGYYVHGHEKGATVAYRYKFIHTYFQYELQIPRWIQISEEMARIIEEQQQIPTGAGYRYNDQLTGAMMVEYHIDNHDSFQEKMTNETQFLLINK
jgi:hypothetical protein